MNKGQTCRWGSVYGRCFILNKGLVFYLVDNKAQLNSLTNESMVRVSYWNDQFDHRAGQEEGKSV